METLICSMTHRVSQIAQMVMNLPGDLGLIPGLGRCLEGNGNPLQYSCLENSMDREAWRATAYGVAKSWTRLDRLTHTYIRTHMTHKRRIDVKADFDYRYWDACPGWMVFVISQRVMLWHLQERTPSLVPTASLPWENVCLCHMIRCLPLDAMGGFPRQFDARERKLQAFWNPWQRDIFQLQLHHRPKRGLRTITHTAM